MKRLVAIAAGGVLAVITFGFVIKAAIHIIQGRPIAHVTGIDFVLLHDTMMLLAVLIAIGL